MMEWYVKHEVSVKVPRETDQDEANEMNDKGHYKDRMMYIKMK